MFPVVSIINFFILIQNLLLFFCWIYCFYSESKSLLCFLSYGTWNISFQWADNSDLRCKAFHFCNVYSRTHYEIIQILCFPVVANLHKFNSSNDKSMTNTVLLCDLGFLEDSLYLYQKKWANWIFEEQKWNFLSEKQQMIHIYSLVLLFAKYLWLPHVLKGTGPDSSGLWQPVVSAEKRFHQSCFVALFFEALSRVSWMLECIFKSMMFWILFLFVFSLRLLYQLMFLIGLDIFPNVGSL